MLWETYVRRVPTSNGIAAAEVREAFVVALDGPPVASCETVDAVGAGDDGEGTLVVVVAGVVGDCGGHGMSA